MSQEETEQQNQSKSVHVTFADDVQTESGSDTQIDEEDSWEVEVNSARSAKPFLGGFRNRKTGFEYHHAATQTFKANLSKPLNNALFSRETQTVQVVTKSQTMYRESGTQMATTGFHYDESNQKVISPKKYFSSDQLHQLKERKAVRIQTLARAWLARKKIRAMREANFLKENSQLAEEQEMIETITEKRFTEVERRKNPKTPEDFALLHAEVEDWVSKEKKRIYSLPLSEEERKAALRQLLKDETKFLQQIDRLKIKAHADNKEQRIIENLKKLSTSKKIISETTAGGEVVKIHTQGTLRAKELKNIYLQLSDPSLTVEERIGVLNQVKEDVEKYPCALTLEMIQLMQRETDLLQRGREKGLEGARVRLHSLFYQYTQTPEFNPEAAKFQVVPVARSNTQPIKIKQRKSQNVA